VLPVAWFRRGAFSTLDSDSRGRHKRKVRGISVVVPEALRQQQSGILAFAGMTQGAR